jgi:hypothetical protein
MAELAMVCAIANETFFWTRTPCVAAGDDNTAIAATLVKIFDSGDMNSLPVVGF